MNKQDYIYKYCNIRMSNRVMSDLLYAAIITKSGLPTSFGIGIYEYNRKQNSYNTVDIKVHIHPSKIEEFELISGVKLQEPIKISIN